MTKKKQLLFVMNSMTVGGAEKSLISTFQSIDYDKYDVDLQLVQNTGLFLQQIHEKVNLLPEFEDFLYYDMPFQQAIIKGLREFKPAMIWRRFRYSQTSRNKALSSAQQEQANWQQIRKVIRPNPKQYDAVIAGLERTPTYYAVECVTAKKKLAYVHLDYDKMNADASFDLQFYKEIDYVLTDSEGCKDILGQFFPTEKEKFRVVENIVSPKLIDQLSQELIVEQLPQDVFKIISVGRLDHQKGYNLAIPALGIAKRKGYKFFWVILGKGPDQEAFEALMEQEGIRENVVFLGIKYNHYPYVKWADLFLQTSRFEGKSIAIDEAKIMQKPILVTNFSTVRDQIEHLETGYIAALNPESIAEGFMELYDNKALRGTLTENLSKQNNGTEYAIEKIYELINS